MRHTRVRKQGLHARQGRTDPVEHEVKKKGRNMNIGIFALIMAALMSPIAVIGIKYNEPPKREEKKIRYPYPREL